MLINEVQNVEENVLEELKAQLIKPTLMFAFRNITGHIDEGRNTKGRRQ